jgi:hypothetical protein
VSPSSTTTYYVRAEGTCNNTSDASQAVSVYPPPQFATGPQSYTAPCNSTAWVSFTASPTSGTSVSSIQWHCADSPNCDIRYYMGATTFTLQVAPEASDEVWCTITDNCGVQATSNHATLTVPDQSTCP